MTLDDAGQAYAESLADAIAADLATHSVDGTLERIIVRWFWEGDPLYLTIHALGTGDEQPSDDDRWSPLEWPSSDREFERTDRILATPTLQAAGSALRESFPHDEDGEDAEMHVPGIFEALRLLPAAVDAAGLTRAEPFVTAASHFEGWGVLESLEQTAPPEVLAALAGALPEE